MRYSPELKKAVIKKVLSSEDPMRGTALPEPATMLLLGLGLIGLAGLGRGKKIFKKD